MHFQDMAIRICVYAASTENATTGKKSIRTRVAPNHASYVRHASKILGWIKNACFRLVCGPSRTPLIYTCLPVACKGAHTRTHTHEHTFVWLPRGYVSNGTYEHARTPSTHTFPPRILPAGPALLPSYPLPGIIPSRLLARVRKKPVSFLSADIGTHTSRTPSV